MTKTFRKLFLVILTLSLVGVFAAAEFNVGVVFATGGLGDRSFNDSVFEGLTRAKEELDITLDYVEPSSIAEFEGHERAFAQSGIYDLIVCLGFDQAESLKKVAGEYPNQKFVLIDAAISAPNVASIVFKDYEKAFLVGALAAQLTTDTRNFRQMNAQNRIGIVGGMEIPLIKTFVAGYTAGAKYVEPKTDVSVAYVGGWSDPAKAKEQALLMYQRGVDIVFQAAGGSGLGVFKAARQVNKYAIGADSNQNYIEPNNILFSAVRRLGNVVVDQINSAMNGTWEGGDFCYGLKEEAMGYDTTENSFTIPEEDILKIEEIRAKIISGEIVVPSTLEEVDAFLKNAK